MINLSVRLRTLPQDRFVFTESVKMGEIDVREAFTNLVIDAEILVDAEEIKSISAMPEVANALKQVVAPQSKQYKPTDWRAKQVVMRDVQWQQRPIIEYIANLHKDEIIKIFKSKLKIPTDWSNALLNNVSYAIDHKALQLSPSTDKKWRSIYVILTSGLDGFLGKFATEFNNAVANNAIAKTNDGFTFQSSLTGFDTTFKNLDPYSGAKLSNTKRHGWDVADEPGYDKEVKNAFVDHFSDIIGQTYPDARVTSIEDNGRVNFTASEPVADDEENLGL